MNVFDFLDTSETPNASRVNLNPVDESRMIEDSIPPAYEEHTRDSVPDALKFQVQDDAHYTQNGYTYGEGPIQPSNERHDSFYLTREQEPDFNFTTPAPKSKHSKSRDKDQQQQQQPDTTSKKSDRKRKRNSPAELDMSLVRAQQDRDDVMMSDAPPMLHSGLTGGLNRLLARPEFPPSPELSGEYVENSPLSPMKRAKQGTSKALMRAQREWEVQQEKERKEKERGRERERKERKASTALVKIKPKKRRDESARASRRLRRRRGESSSMSPERERKGVKAIEYHPQQDSDSQDHAGALIVRDRHTELTHVRGANAGASVSRAELFMSFITKGPESERGMSVNKALKRYHRERYDRGERELEKRDEEKELWKSLRLKRNERGEIVLFFEGAEEL